MKRVAFILAMCIVAFVAVRIIAPRYGEIISGAGVKPPSLQPEIVELIQPRTVVTSLPPLTNLTIRPQRAVTFQAAEAPKKTNEVTPALPQKKSGKPPRQDLLARVALASVGIDPVAEQYWVMAINDPSLGEAEREDLIEDLNEEGFEDPKNPTVEELPLIINRLQIIEEYAPQSMDEVNARSFAEAYKDLANMFVRLTGQEPP